MAGHGAIGTREVVVSGRLKATDAIVAKMRRFGEPLRVMLDVWGCRAVVATEGALDDVAARCAELWETPTPPELLLRHGQLQFDCWRDYRRRSHAGLSAAPVPPAVFSGRCCSSMRSLLCNALDFTRPSRWRTL